MYFVGKHRKSSIFKPWYGRLNAVDRKDAMDHMTKCRKITEEEFKAHDEYKYILERMFYPLYGITSKQEDWLRDLYCELLYKKKKPTIVTVHTNEGAILIDVPAIYKRMEEL